MLLQLFIIIMKSRLIHRLLLLKDHHINDCQIIVKIHFSLKRTSFPEF